MNISDRVGEAWGRTQVSWRGEAAIAFYGQYIPPMQETADRFDIACQELAEHTQLLDRELSDIESALSE